MKSVARLRRFWKWVPLYLLALPGLAYFLINNYIPLEGLVIAFKNYSAKSGIWGSPWVGLKNFEFLFISKDAWVITRNTLGYNLTFIVVNTILGIALAIYLNEIRNKTPRKIYQTMILLPYLMSMVVVGYIVSAFLGENTGIFNAILRGLGGQNVQWYTTQNYWPFILVFVNTWRMVGFDTIIYLASIVGFGEQYYEAAEIDGATKLQQIRHITIPMLKPSIVMLLTMSMGRIFRSDFGLFYQVPRNNGLLYEVTQTIDTYVYRSLLQKGDISMSAAASFYQSFVCLAMILFFNWLMHRYSRENALF